MANIIKIAACNMISLLYYSHGEMIVIAIAGQLILRKAINPELYFQ